VFEQRPQRRIDLALGEKQRQVDQDVVVRQLTRREDGAKMLRMSGRQRKAGDVQQRRHQDAGRESKQMRMGPPYRDWRSRPAQRPTTRRRKH
jgi:hypothetical protein